MTRPERRKRQLEEWDKGNQGDDSYEINPDGNQPIEANKSSGILTKRRQLEYTEAVELTTIKNKELIRKAEVAHKREVKLHSEKIKLSGFEMPYSDPRVICDRSIKILKHLQVQGFPCHRSRAWGSHRIFLEIEETFGRVVFRQPPERVTSTYVDNKPKHTKEY